jgi:hypothetical protein
MSIERSNLLGALCVLSLAHAASAYQNNGNFPITGEPATVQLPIAAAPAGQPVVTVKDGMLSVQAKDCSLRDVLTGIQKAVGMTVDMPPDVNERVVLQLGPGRIKEILAALMDGGKYNYVVISSASRPDGVDRLILTPRHEMVGDVAPTRNAVVMPSIVSPPPAAPDDGGETVANTVEKKADPNHPDDPPDEPEIPQ